MRALYLFFGTGSPGILFLYIMSMDLCQARFNIRCLLLFHRGMVDASGDQFVAYFLPTTDTIRKRKRDQEGEKEYTEEEE